MRRTEPLRSFTDRPGYGDECAVCPLLRQDQRLDPG